MDYMTRIEKVITDNIAGDVVVLAFVYSGRMSTYRDDYWERVYYVAWQNDSESGTHEAHINSKGESALFYGHYQLTETDAVHDMIERAGLSVGRI